MKPLVAANWKMHKTPTEAQSWVKEFLEELPEANAEVALCAPFTHLFAMHALLKDTPVALGARHEAQAGELGVPRLHAGGAVVAAE
jgi:triosephosphate isomerase (TIM)